MLVQKCMHAWKVHHQTVTDECAQEVAEVRRRIALRTWSRRADRLIVLRGRAWTVTNRVHLRLLHSCHETWQIRYVCLDQSYPSTPIALTH